ncbi:MAG: tRNA (adenosine(37)-N6)-threonylcarbamoyltransferase complex ATPase subunit type 1 TsaE [Flavobacteriales bacterium]|nr:tRNA (adenosine(37)-N6)-threonylcarbamoyltransferase complex ATPase subunit type 1 TsaE [Flavobacteriales bacterium]|tara:strand:+ start:147 stop:560 length:414 start_codon:yes stop_codon:yes gene_type:complete
MELKSKEIDNLNNIAFEIIKKAGKRKIILFYGEMGVGKTTLIKEICQRLGVKENVSSPTFGIVNSYLGLEGEVYHFDAYRIESKSEAIDLGIEEYLYSGNWCLIEWPEKIKDLLAYKSDLLEVNIKLNSEYRIYNFG